MATEESDKPDVDMSTVAQDTEHNSTAQAPSGTDATASEVKEPPPAPEVPSFGTELEQDAPVDNRPKVAGQVGFPFRDTTLNVMPSRHGDLLMAYSEAGMQYFLAGARGNCGVKAGRYLFEVRIVEILDPQDQVSSQRFRSPIPRQLLRIGFSTAKSSLFLGDSEESVCFDSEGKFTHNRTSVHACDSFSRDQVLGLVLNLDPNSPNAYTLSIFRDGVRISKPQPLPDNLKGKTLFPALTFRCLTLAANFGPSSGTQMRFSCRMIADAAKDDAELLESKSSGAKSEVLFLMSLPDEGSFDWVDHWSLKNAGYEEISDRKILEWAEKSGLWRHQGYGWKTSNDKPDMNLGHPAMDDATLKRLIYTIASTQQRNFLVVEVKDNLIAAERSKLLSFFAKDNFKRNAQVVMGDPTADFKAKVQDLLLKDKQAKADLEFKAKKADELRAKLIEKQQQELAREQRRRERAQAKAEREARRAAAAEAGEDVPMEEEPAEEEEKEEEIPQIVDDEKPPKVELTPEERKQLFRKTDVPDVSLLALGAAFAQFTIPTQAEGFDQVIFPWHTKTKSEAYLKDWQQSRRLTIRVEDIQPSDWFNKQWSSWQAQLQKWKQHQTEWKAEYLRKERDGEVQAQKMETDSDDLDVFGVSDVSNIGNGEPLYAHFSYEDWSLLSLRFEMHLLGHSFDKDVRDRDCVGIHIDNLPFYYNKYFKKSLVSKNFGVETNQELLDFVKDTVALDSRLVLETQLSEGLDNFDIFLKLTEDCRRDRKLLVDSGDDSAKLKFSHASASSSGSGFSSEWRSSSYGPSYSGSHGSSHGKGPYSKGGGKSSDRSGSRGFSGGGGKDFGKGGGNTQQGQWQKGGPYGDGGHGAGGGNNYGNKGGKDGGSSGKGYGSGYGGAGGGQQSGGKQSYGKGKVFS